MEKDDRRVRKTKKALYDALQKLLARKSLNKITINELTELADIHRDKHYADIFALYDEIEASALDAVDRIFNEDPQMSYETVYLELMDYICENTDLWKILQLFFYLEKHIGEIEVSD